MKFPGNELRQRRVELELSTERVAVDCAIPIAVIDALENGATDRLPASCYAVGFIQSYCRRLGLEPEYYTYALKQSRTKSSRKPRRAGSGVVDGLFARIHLPGIFTGFNSELQSWLVVTLVMAMAWFSYSLVMRPDASPVETQAQAASLELRLPQLHIER